MLSILPARNFSQLRQHDFWLKYGEGKKALEENRSHISERVYEAAIFLGRPKCGPHFLSKFGPCYLIDDRRKPHIRNLEGIIASYKL
jgi:hypothetical protein